MGLLDRIETPHLRLLALDASLLRACVEAPERVHEALGIRFHPGILDDDARRAVAIKLDNLAALSAAVHPWATYWLLVPRDEQSGVGLAGFKGVPDAAGTTEIGYGVDPAHRRRGYATEAVAALLRWAFEHEDCRSVSAQVRRDNPASRRVLERQGMRLVREADDMLEFVATRESLTRPAA